MIPKDTRIKLTTKRDFSDIRFKYFVPTLEIERTIRDADRLDVFVLKLQFEEGFWVIKKIVVLNESKEEEFVKLLKEGI